MQLDLKAARRKRGLSLGKLAKQTGLTKSTISRIERGMVRPLHETIVALEAALRCRLDVHSERTR